MRKDGRCVGCLLMEDFPIQWVRFQVRSELAVALKHARQGHMQYATDRIEDAIALFKRLEYELDRGDD